MAIDMDYGSINPDKIGEQTPLEFVSEPGRCHAVLTEFLEYGDTKSGGRHIAKWEIVAHEKATELGKVFWDYLNHPSPHHKDSGDFARQTLFAYAIALGVTTQQELARLATEGKNPTLDFSGCAGRQAFLILRGEEYEGKTRIKCNAIYHVGDERAKSFPRNNGVLKNVGGTATPPPATSQPPAEPTPSPFAGL